MPPRIKVEVYCMECSEGNVPDDMNIEGPLYVNREAQTQAQHYKCKSCGKSVSVVLIQEEVGA